MRTAPLWGLRLQTTLLHDGRATSITDAIWRTTARPAARGNASRRSRATGKKLLAFLAGL
jgi:CxxC motif-containing protein (DUF1111 family)